MDSAQENKIKKYIIKGSPYGETKLVLEGTRSSFPALF